MNLIINKTSKIYKYDYCPKSGQELFELLCDIFSANFKKGEVVDGINLNNIDVSRVKSMRELFYQLYWVAGWRIGKIDISEWDVSNCKDFIGMFEGCDLFGCDISNWNVNPKAKKMNMFYGCTSMAGKIPAWIHMV